jgi:hypothetical protein
MSIKQSFHKGDVPVHMWTQDVEHTALEQLLNVSRLPIVHPLWLPCPMCTSVWARPWAR